MRTQNHAKLVFLTVLSAVTMLFSSCDKDDEDTITASIIGEWIIDDFKSNLLINGVKLEDHYKSLGVPAEQITATVQTYNELYLTTIKRLSMGVHFKEDGAYMATVNNAQPNSGTWSLSGDSRTLVTDKGTAEEQTYKVLVLNDTSLQLEVDASITVEAGQGQMGEKTPPIEVKASLKYHRKKSTK